MNISDESLEQLEQSRNFWKRLALGQLLLLALAIAAGVAVSGLMAVRARQAELAAREQALRALEAAHQAEEAAEAERRARQK